MGMPPTGRWTESYGAIVTTFDDDGVVIEGAVYWNPLAMFQPARADRSGARRWRPRSAPAARWSATAARAPRGPAQSGGASTRKRSPAAT